MLFDKDPVGFAINDYQKHKFAENIVVKSDLCEDDILPVQYLFRDFEDMPEIEQFALLNCSGKILDIGAGAGCHSSFLLKEGLDVIAMDTSPGACAFLESKKIHSINQDFMQFSGQKFDTILLLMNGIGLAGSLKKLPATLHHLKNLLNPNGKIFCDSTDINYMYTNDDGSVWMDLNAAYYGEMNFNMVYRGTESGWFPWLYIDQHKLAAHAIDAGFKIDIVMEGENNHYLAELQIK